MSKSVPLRMCIACRQMKDKHDLCRIVRNSDGEIYLDATLKANGRGAYICRDISCLDKAIKSKALNRAFKCDIPQNIIEDLRKNIIN